jgi:hypothetical protein
MNPDGDPDMRQRPNGQLCAFLLLGCAFAAASGCSTPLTDITATASEDVGAWNVTNAKANGDVLTANVCMEDPDSADAVSDRLLLQLRNKGYQRIELSMYAPGGEGARQQQVTWSTREGKQLLAATQAGQNPCDARNAASEPASREH